MGTLRELNFPQYVFGGDSSIWDDINETPQRPDFQVAYNRGWKFNYHRATFGMSVDSDYKVNWENSRKTPLLLGAYHFLVWNQSPEAQADYFFNLIKFDPGELPIIVDFEWWSVIPSNAFDLLYRFLERMKILLNQAGIKNKLGIYTAYYFWKQYGKTDPYWKQYVLWLARYEVTPPIGPTLVPAPWTKADFWQYSGHGDGIYYGMESKDVDLDYFLGTYEELLVLCNLENQGDPTPVYENNALAIYIDSTRKVSDWDALAGSVDYVLIRGIEVPIKAGDTYFNYDTAKTIYEYARLDSDYISNFIEAKKRGLKVGTVIELNPAFDKDIEYNRDDFAKHIKAQLMSVQPAIGDFAVVQVVHLNWIENNRVTRITAYNLDRCLKRLFPALRTELNGITIYGWSSSTFINDDLGGEFKYETFLRDSWLDNANAGEPTWPFGFTYQKLPGWSLVVPRSVASPRETVKLIPGLTAEIVANHLTIGSYTGWNAKNKSGQGYNHGFFSVVGTKVPWLTGYVEPIIFDCDKETFDAWMGWNVVTPPPGEEDPTELEVRVKTLEDKLNKLIKALSEGIS